MINLYSLRVFCCVVRVPEITNEFGAKTSDLGLRSLSRSPRKLIKTEFGAQGTIGRE